MSQRLVIRIYNTIEDEQNNEAMASIYYRWSGFTKSAIDELLDLIKYYSDTELTDINALQMYFTNSIISIGGYVHNTSLEWFDANGGKPHNGSSQCGIIAVDKEGQDELYSYAEATAKLILNQGVPLVDIFDIFAHYLNEDYIDVYEDEPASLPFLKINLEENLSVEELIQVQEYIEEIPHFVIHEDYVTTIIE